MMCHMQTGLQAPTQTAATGSWKVSMSGTSPAIADHWRRRVDLDLRQRPASSWQVSRSTIGGAPPPTNCLVIGGCANDVKKLPESLIKLGCPSRHSCRSTEVLVGR